MRVAWGDSNTSITPSPTPAPAPAPTASSTIPTPTTPTIRTDADEYEGVEVLACGDLRGDLDGHLLAGPLSVGFRIEPVLRRLTPRDVEALALRDVLGRGRLHAVPTQCAPWAKMRFKMRSEMRSEVPGGKRFGETWGG